jgi:predicted transcriptional regulator
MGATLWSIVAREHLSIRIDPETRRQLEREADRRRMPKTSLAEQLLREAIQSSLYPGIVFRDGPAGRRPGLAGGPDLWEVIEVWQDEGRRPASAAESLDLPMGLVEAALGYYADHQAEVDDWITANRRESEEGEDAWRRRRSLSAG